MVIPGKLSPTSPGLNSVARASAQRPRGAECGLLSGDADYPWQADSPPTSASRWFAGSFPAAAEPRLAAMRARFREVPSPAGGLATQVGARLWLVWGSSVLRVRVVDPTSELPTVSPWPGAQLEELRWLAHRNQHLARTTWRCALVVTMPSPEVRKAVRKLTGKAGPFMLAAALPNLYRTRREAEREVAAMCLAGSRGHNSASMPQRDPEGCAW